MHCHKMQVTKVGRRSTSVITEHQRVAVTYNIHETLCSMLRLHPHYLLRLQNNHNVPFNNCKQEEALTCRASDVNSPMDINSQLFIFFFFFVNFTAQI